MWTWSDSNVHVLSTRPYCPPNCAYLCIRILRRLLVDQVWHSRSRHQWHTCKLHSKCTAGNGEQRLFLQRRAGRCPGRSRQWEKSYKTYLRVVFSEQAGPAEYLFYQEWLGSGGWRRWWPSSCHVAPQCHQCPTTLGEDRTKIRGRES